MKTIRYLADHAGMLKNQCGHKTLRVIAPECVLSEESMKTEDEDEMSIKKMRKCNQCEHAMRVRALKVYLLS